MKKVFLFFLTLCITTTQVTLSKADNQNVPVIKFESMQLNLGDVKEGEELTCTFKFTNAGKAPLMIKSVEKVCGMNHAEFPKEAIAPGAEGEIHMSYNTHDRVGLFRRSITVKTNMGPDKDLYLLVKANVVPTEGAQIMADGTKKSKSKKDVAPANGPSIQFNENNHNFGTIEAGTPGEYAFRFTNNGTEALLISEANLSEAGYAVVDYPTDPIAPGETGIIKVVYNTDGKEGKFNHSIKVRSNDTANNDVELQVKGKIKKSTASSSK